MHVTFGVKSVLMKINSRKNVEVYVKSV